MHRRRHDLLLIAAALLCVGVACLSAAAQRPAPLRAWAAIHGASMTPAIPDGCLIELDVGVPFSDLRAGQIAVFRSADAAYPIKAHRLVVKRGDGWVTKGDANPRPDAGWVTEQDYLAVATGKTARVVCTNNF